MPDSTDSPATPPADRRVLYLRWRPSTFANVVGQEHAVRTLRNAAASGRLAHAYLFSGPRGTGKTSIARILYKAANCPNAVDGEPCDKCTLCTAANEGRSLDLIEMDAASNRGIDDIRDLRDRVHFSPVEGKYRVYIVDEAHELTRDAWDAFLKTLEEPPPHVIFVLATTESHRVPPTIASRCQRFDFRRLPLESVTTRLRAIAESESIEVAPGVLEAIARLANGGMRDAISLLDQLRAYCGTSISEDDARTVLGLPAAGTARQLLSSLSQGDLAQALSLLDESISLGVDMRLLIEELLEHTRGLLLAGFRATAVLEHEMGAETVDWLQNEIRAWRRGPLLTLTRGLAEALTRVRETHRLRLEVELLFTELVARLESAEPAAGPVPAAPERAAPIPPPSKPAPPRSAVTAPSTERPRPVQPADSAAPQQSTVIPPVALMDPAAPPADEPGEADGMPPEPVPPEPVTLDRVRGTWRAVVDTVAGQNGPLGAVLDAAQPMSVEGATIMLGVPYAFHVRLIMDQTKRRVIEDVWSRALGSSVRVECRPAQEESRPHPSAAAIDDPVVRAALEIFGGEATVIEDEE